MQFDVDDTIAAVASAAGSALRGIIRISGPETLNILDQTIDSGLLRIADANSFQFKSMQTAKIVGGHLIFGPQQQLAADISVWPNHSSFTRQPSAEIHTLGCEPLLAECLHRLVAIGCRLAEPGEFTMRAFLSGRIDLTQAEAVLGMIEAKTKRQFDISLAQMSGGIGGPIQSIKENVMHVLAEMEAGLDFVEEDIEFISQDDAIDAIDRCLQQMTGLATQLQNRNAVDGFHTVVLAGPPNAGKSSLFNRLAGGTAIVSPQAGTTRDYLQMEVDFCGTAVRIIDTAGLEEVSDNDDTIAGQMFEMTNEQTSSADLILWCQASDATSDDTDYGQWHLNELAASEVLIVNTKSDLVSADERRGKELLVSSKTAEGIGRLKKNVCDRLNATSQPDLAIPATIGRIEESVVAAQQSLKWALEAARLGHGDEVVAAELHGTLQHLGKIVGAIYTDDILDLVFSQFCIGK